jgi:hypothetical protein
MRANYMRYFSKEIPNAGDQAQIGTNVKIDPRFQQQPVG